jgi:hypothetical protein
MVTNSNNDSVNFQFVHQGINTTEVGGYYAECNLTLDGATVATNPAVFNGTPTILKSNTSFSQGLHTWNVSCANFSESATSTARTFTYDVTNPNVTLHGPANLTNTSNPSVNLTYNVTDNFGGPYNCTVMVNGGLYNSSSMVANNTVTGYVSSYSAGTYVWYVTCRDNASNNGISSIRQFTVDQTPATINSISLGEVDIFVSDAAENNNITILANISDASGVAYVTANFTALDQTGPDFVNLTYDGLSNGLWNVTIQVTDTRDDDFSMGAISLNIFAADKAGNIGGVGQNSVQVVLYNMSLPDPMACAQWGPLTTNFSKVADFAHVNFMLQHMANLSCITPGIPGSAPSWTRIFEPVVLINFSSINLSTPQQAQKLQGLRDAFQATLVPPNQYGDSRIYFNTTYFVELNTTTTIVMYHLPFSAQPNIRADAEAAGYNPASLVWVSGRGEGNLTFSVYGFSGYNMTDNVTPTVTFNTPVSGYKTNDNTPFINVTLNGTGTQITRADFSIDSVPVGTFSNATNTARCVNVTEGSELFMCSFNVSSALSDATNHNFTVTAYDYGGMSPGNMKISSILFTVDTTGPTVTLASPADASTTNNPVVNLTFSASDSTGGPYNCSLYVGAVFQQWGWAVDGVVTNFTKVFANGTYSWNVTCLDNVSNIGASSVRTFTVDQVAPINTSGFTSSASTDAATISATMNESSKCNVIYGTASGTLTSSVNSSSFGTSMSVSLSGLSASTTYYYNITSCWDSLNNARTLNYGTFSFTTSAASSGGGGGGGSSSVPVTYSMGDIGDVGSMDVSVIKNDKVTLKKGLETHTITVQSVGYDSVALKVDSVSQYSTLLIGETKLFDLDFDGSNDISIKLDKIVSSKATLLIRSLIAGETVPIKVVAPAASKPKVTSLAPALVEEAPAAPEVTAPAPETAPVQEPVVAPSPAPAVDSGSQKGSYVWWIIGLVVVLGLIAGIVYYYLTRDNLADHEIKVDLKPRQDEKHVKVKLRK